MPIEDSIKVVQDMSRRAALEKMLAEDPQDVFLHYALANELVKAGEHAAAWDRFALLHRDFPDYVPAWFRHAQALGEAGETDEARTVGQQALVVAERVGDMHAAGEIRGFLEMLS